MSWQRWSTITAHEGRTQLRGPLFWALIALLVAAVATMNPTAMIPGSGAVSGEPPIVNSAHAIGQSFALVSFFLYNFIAAFMGGLAVIQDREKRVIELLHATPLTRSEYVWGKFAGIVMPLVVVLAMHAMILAAFHHLVPGWNPDAPRGPLAPGFYVVAALAFTAPAMVFSAGIAFAVGARSGQALLVHAVPTTIFLVTVFVFNAWPLHGLPRPVESALMVLDPSGLRWLRQTAFAIDRGVEFYNTAAISFDTTFWLGRFLTMSLPLFLVWNVTRADLTAVGTRSRRHRWWRPPGVRRTASRQPADVTASATGPADPASATPRGHRATPRGTWRDAFVVARAEVHELLAQPAVALFGILILAMMIEFVTTAEVAGASVIPSSGRFAVGTHPVLVFLGCLLLLFTGTESLTREQRSGTVDLIHSTPVTTGALLFGKALASTVVLGGVLAACAALGLVLIGLAGDGERSVWPLLLVWGGLLTPTYALWSSFVTVVAAVARGRAATVAIGLLALTATGYHALTGNASWATSWTLAGFLRWSDMGAFDLEAGALILNRLLVLGLAVFLWTLAIRAHERTVRDPEANRQRRRPAVLARRAAPLIPLVLLPVALGSVLALQIANGEPGATTMTEAAGSGQRSSGTVHRDALLPAILHVDLDLELMPADRRVRVDGRYVIANPGDRPLGRLPWTLAVTTDDVHWTLDHEAAPREQHGSLHVLKPSRPLAPAATCTVGFRYEARIPPGLPRRYGAVEQFVLPAGVVLHTLRDSFLPMPGWPEEPGPAEPHRKPPAGHADRWRPAAGTRHGFTTRIAVTAPRGYTVNSVGTRLAEDSVSDQTTVTWASEVPVRALNVVAGRWDVRRHDGAAVFFHPKHDRNVDEILSALAAARRWYGTWFGPYPWPELRLSEFPDRVSLAQGFASNITLSEGLGFIVRSDPGSSLPFAVTAHEAAHQWWGNLIPVADGPGADVLLEGMANYATLLLHQAERGLRGRIAFAELLEDRYRTGRRTRTERPLLEMVDTGEPGTATVVFDKGAWALWMLHGHLGEERMLAGLGDFSAQHRLAAPGALPTLGDLLATLRTHAADTLAYDRVAEQWFAQVVMPDLRVLDAESQQRDDGRWAVEATVANLGTGTVDVVIGASRGERFPGTAPEVAVGYREARRSIRLSPDAPRRVRFDLSFRPDRIVVDPDAEVLQLGRERAIWAFSADP